MRVFNKKTTVFHECYVDAIGKVHEPERSK